MLLLLSSKQFTKG